MNYNFLMLKSEMKVLNIVSIALVAGVVAIAAYVFCAPFRVGLLVALGRSPYCSLRNALKAPSSNERHFALSAEFEKGSHVVNRIPELDIALWQTPKGAIWFPRNESPSFLLTEQERRIYGDVDNGVRSGDIVLDCGAHVGVFTRRRSN